MKKKILFISIFFLSVLAHKIILSKIILFSLEKWVDKDIVVKEFNIVYKKKKIHINEVKIKDKDSLSGNIFSAEKISLKIRPKSLFSKLIIIENVEITNPVLNINFDISKKDKKLLNDNLGISENSKNKNNPKIYPKKIIDINFLILKSTLENFKIEIKRSDKKDISFITLSDMYFYNFGNEKRYQHYKDVFKKVLTDLIMRIPDQELKKIIKKSYKPFE